MKRTKKLAWLLVFLFLLSFALMACAQGSGDTSGDAAQPTQAPPDTQESPGAQESPRIGEGRTFTLAVWGGNNPKVLDEYLVPRFEQETGATFEYLTGSTTDRLTKLYTEKGNPSIDVAIVPIDSVSKLLKDDVILPADETIPNYDKLIPEAKLPGGYGVSIQVVAVGYSLDRVSQPPTSWEDLWGDQYKNRIALGAIPGANGVAFLAMINRLAGGDETDLSLGIAKVKALKPIRAFYDESGQIPPMIENNEIDVFTMLSGLTASFKAAGAPIGIVIPEEGSPITMNVAVIPKGTKNLDLAKKAIEILLSEELQKGYAQILYYAPTNSTVVLPADLAEIIHPQKGDKLIQLDWDALELQNETMLEAWNKEVVSE
ncbi:MAG: extracellular solute-binding protein [Bacillota bacterium]